MSLPAGISLCTVTVGRAFNFFGEDAEISVKVTPILGGNAKRIVWTATGELLANFAGTFTGTVGEQVEFEVPHVDQPGFVDGTGDEFTLWFYRAEISLLIGRQTVQYQQDFQVLVGQDAVDLDLVPDASIGAPVSVTIPPVLSVNGQTGIVMVGEGSLIGWAANPDSIIFGTITRNVDGVVTTADVVWPDGTPGTYTADDIDGLLTNAYSITYEGDVDLTVTQPLMTRDGSDQVAVRPPMEVS